MINLKNIDFFYQESNYIFKNFNLELQDQKKYWLKGKNGSGKTTLINILLGILKVKKGICELNYHKTRTLYVPSSPFYEPFMEVYDFMMLYLNKILKIPMNEEQLVEIMHQLDLINHRSTLCKDLSKGTIQKIIISPLFTNFSWEYLFLDEPFEHLDMKSCQLLKNKIMQSECFTFLINHKEELIYSHNDRMGDMYEISISN